VIEFKKFYDLFKGNPDAYGADTPHGVRCVREDAILGVHEHLEMGLSAGIYPMYEDRVKWGCSDIDNGSWDDAHNLWLVLQRMELNPFIELSRSKGYHVWVFAEDWVPAWVMRRAFLFAHYVTDQLGTPVPPTEVNPKAEELEPGQLGNFVRLPYVHGAADENGRRTMLDDTGEPISLELFLNAAPPVSVSKLRRWADKYQPPRRHLSQWKDSSMEAIELAKALTGKGFIIWRDGPPEWDSRRSNTMARLAIECARSGLDKSEALILIGDLDDRLEKWTGRSVEGTAAARRSCVEWGYEHI
jgi:TOTE conflict system, Archaeo-Eukaryotic Primase domain